MLKKFSKLMVIPLLALTPLFMPHRHHPGAEVQGSQGRPISHVAWVEGDPVVREVGPEDWVAPQVEDQEALKEARNVFDEAIEAAREQTRQAVREAAMRAALEAGRRAREAAEEAAKTSAPQVASGSNGSTSSANGAASGSNGAASNASAGGGNVKAGGGNPNAGGGNPNAGGTNAGGKKK